MRTDPFIPTEPIARRVLEVVDAGLCAGVGEPTPGRMCVEAAVCYALGQPHGDKPSCVGTAVRQFKIRLNDAAWPSDAARAAGMRKLAVAQLGSEAIDQRAFAAHVAIGTVKRILPPLLRARGLEELALTCERVATREEAREAASVARQKLSAADAYDAYAAADAAAGAAYAAAFTAAEADASGFTAAFTADAFTATAAAAAAGAAAAALDSHEILLVGADIGLQALIELKSPGCEFLWLCEADE